MNRHLKERFRNAWAVTFSLLSLVILFDLVVQFTSGTFSITETLLVITAVVLMSLVIATVLTLLLPVLNFLFSPLVFKSIASVIVVTLAYLHSWWILLGLFVVMFPSRFFVQGGGANSGYSEEDEKHFEEQKRQDEWNNSAEKHARDYDQWRSHNEPPRY